ncbi:MAG TPA: hopanoid biosynthesis-associated protein HpnK [Chthonomonadaceae bacterium]|nr:hopanoid biosynthesis-associated protein HpnK [Chthonomonadaceae bacterium]
MKHLIINADDFGYSARVNAAVLRAHREGVLTSASLMVAEAGWREAVAIARRTPTLGVGLHVVTTFDKAVLPAQEIPHLLGAQGKFGADPLRVGLRYAFSRAARRELRREMEAQFERFAQTGLPWSHVDGHQHFHMHPVVWDYLLDLCDRYGVHRLRIPHEKLRAHLRDGGDGPNLNTAALLALRVLRRRNLRVLRARKTLGGRPPFFCDRVYGHLQSSNMNAAYLLRLLERLNGTAVEIYFHPGTDYARPLPPAQQTEDVRDVELHALLDPAVRAKIETLGLCTGRYADVEAAIRISELGTKSGNTRGSNTAL